MIDLNESELYEEVMSIKTQLFFGTKLTIEKTAPKLRGLAT